MPSTKDKKTNVAKKITIFYHGDCHDGFAAAWVIWKKFGDKAKYIPVNHETPPPPIKNNTIYLIDINYSQKTIDELTSKNEKIIVINHQEEPKNRHSTAILVWENFFPNKKNPKLLNHIEDYDLWLFKLAGTEKVNAYLEMIGFNFKAWDLVIKNFGKSQLKKKIIEEGGLLLEYRDKWIKRIIEQNSELVEFLEYKVLAINSPIWVSKIGHALEEKMPPIGIVWSAKNHHTTVSLRSNNETDVSELARRFGGGGQNGAASFSVATVQELPWKTIIKS